MFTLSLTTINLEISRCHSADYVKEFYSSACRTCSTIIFPHSTNQIIVFWRRRCRCRCRCSSLLSQDCTVICFHDFHVLCIRLCAQHHDDPIQNCWYAPANHGDTFGIRHDEMYFHEDIIPSQPVTSYAVLIRGSPWDAGTSVDGGIGEHFVSRDDSSKSSKNVTINRAVSLIHGLMKAREFYTSGEFTQDTMKGRALSMQWYNYIFSCSMQFLPGSIERHKAPDSLSRHIVVMVRGNMYKVELIRSDEEGFERIIPSSQLKVSCSGINDLYKRYRR